MKLTIAVCTHQRPKPLGNLLASIDKSQQPDDLDLGLVVIWNDRYNADFDSTQQILDGMWISSKLVIEENIGLSHARNTALKNWDGDYLYFVDDDVILNEDTFLGLSNYLSEHQPDIFGTRVVLHDEGDIDITTTTLSSLQSMTKNTNPLSFIHGCSMAISNKTIEKMGCFDTLLGAGGRLKSGEDLDYVVRSFNSGLNVEFVPTILVRHDHGRKDSRALRLLCDGYAIGAGAVVAKHLLTGQFYMLKWHCIDIRNALRNGFRNRSLSELNTWAFRRFVYAAWGGFLYLTLLITQNIKQRV